MMNELKRTPLFEVYKQYRAKTINFGGWELPVQFTSIKEEHYAVRTNAGLFDVSHMGEIIVKGKDSLQFLQKILTNDVSKLRDGKAQYTIMCYEDGGCVDDLIVYRLNEEKYLLVVNAANIQKDFQWLMSQKHGDVELQNISESCALLALQGQKAEKVLQTLTDVHLSELKFFEFIESAEIAGKKALIARTGYTGEDGFEIYCQSEDAVYLWEKILQAGDKEKVVPCGLGARDTLRLEAALPLYGQDLSEDITPIEAGVGFAVKLTKKENFIGKDVLQIQKEQGVSRLAVGLEMIEKGIPRSGYKLFSGNQQIGVVTSGTHSPTLNKSIGIALVKKEFSEIGNEIEVEVRTKRLKARVVPTPFYKRPTKNGK
ncbi:glycine cleavage system aminomethyltransferase GcvT [Aeribacillus composti]|uniref:Aminomethyltransferase n=1 Tax=Aeribacillus composti TaxID=1868734 RepID=A0ABY9W7J2_9BACI|nr:glycine cleavage system aminomethyltransferase GcvT [Aeribacillus composti]WNF32105.1 glycine cleavage system aminomethyltransferase GcvT [Aeribacillus composti]